MPKSWKGLDGLRLWCIFPDGRCHFVFCINWLNLLALCTYFTGNHSLLSIGQKSSLALEPSWSGEGGMRDVLRTHSHHPKLPLFRWRKEVAPEPWICFAWGMVRTAWVSHRRWAMLKNFPELCFLPVCPFLPPWRTNRFLMFLFQVLYILLIAGCVILKLNSPTFQFWGKKKN